jgi:hypothetical protein
MPDDCGFDMNHQVGVIGDFHVTPVGVESGIDLQLIHFGQNYPNPFNPTTEIEFDLFRHGPTCKSSIARSEGQNMMIRNGCWLPVGYVGWQR